MAEVQILTVEDVKAAARKAYDERRLLAQVVTADDPLPNEMFATKDGHCCAIGAALSDETIALLRAGGNLSGTINGLIARCQVKVSPPGPRTADLITEIMIAHDVIMGEPSQRERHEQEFLRLIDHPSAKAAPPHRKNTED